MKRIFFRGNSDSNVEDVNRVDSSIKSEGDLVHILKSNVILESEDRKKLLLICTLIVFLIFVFFFVAIEAFGRENYFAAVLYTLFVAFSLGFLWDFIGNLKTVKVAKWTALVLFTLLQISLFLADSSAKGIMWSLTFPVISIFLVGSKFGAISSLVLLFSILLTERILLGRHFYDRLGSTDHEIDFHFVVIYVLLLLISLGYELIKEGMRRSFKQVSKKMVDSIRLLEQSRDEYQTLMKDVVVGLLLLDENLTIQKSYSHSVRYIFGAEKDLANENFFHFIKQKTFAGAAFRVKKKLDELISNTSQKNIDGKDVGEDKSFSTTVQIRDESFKDQIKVLSLSFSSVRLYNGMFHIMVRVKDITHREKLKKKLHTEDVPKRRDMKIVEEALGSNRALFKIFLKMVGEKNELLKELQVELVKRSKMENFNVAEVSDIIEQVFSVTHALKGNASIAGFATSADILHNVEVDLKKIDFHSFQDGKDQENFSKSLLTSVEIIERIYRHFEDLNFIMDELFSFANESSEEKSMMDLEWIIDSTVTSYNATAEEKVNVHISTKKFNPAILKRMNKQQQAFIFDSIVQLVKNSLVHGFKQFKDTKTVPTITISDILEKRDGKTICIIDYRDNGRGIDWKNVKGADGNLVSFDEAKKRIFDVNYSGSTKVDTHAGNGLGMSMIKKSAEKIGVSINIPLTKKGFSLQFLIGCD